MWGCSALFYTSNNSMFRRETYWVTDCVFLVSQVVLSSISDSFPRNVKIETGINKSTCPEFRIRLSALFMSQTFQFVSFPGSEVVICNYYFLRLRRTRGNEKAASPLLINHNCIYCFYWFFRNSVTHCCEWLYFFAMSLYERKKQQQRVHMKYA